MGCTYLMLQKIQKTPGLFLGKKSLDALGHFLDGYEFRIWVENWEKATGLDFFENYEEASRSSVGSKPREQRFMYGFDRFVHLHYNCGMTVKSGIGLILEMSDSDEEAFDTFFELLDEFLKQKEASDLPVSEMFRFE